MSGMGLPRVSDSAGKIALGIVAIVEVPQVWSQWQPSVSTLRGGDWPGMEESVKIGAYIAWGYALGIAALVSWIIGAWWPLFAAVLVCALSHYLYHYFVTHKAEPTEGNKKDDNSGTSIGGSFTAFLPDFSG